MWYNYRLIQDNPRYPWLGNYRGRDTEEVDVYEKYEEWNYLESAAWKRRKTTITGVCSFLWLYLEKSNATFHVRILFQKMYWKCRIMAKATVVKLCSRQLSFSWVFFVVVVVAEHAKGWWTRLVLKDNNCFLGSIGQVWPPNQHHREQRKQSNKSLFTQYFHCCGVFLLLNQEGGVWGQNNYP